MLVSNKSELQRTLENPQSQAALIESLAIARLLDFCIIEKNYRISDQWTQPIQFTNLGQQIIDELRQRYQRVKPNEAKMAVFLSFACPEGLLVDLSTDVDALRQQLSREILSRRIRFPYIFGRELHDVAAELYPARTRLDNAQTIKVLDKLPPGVFQYGRTVVGPYGCTYSDVPRLMPASNRVPGYLCSDPACNVVHILRLDTGDTAIIKARELLQDIITKKHSEVPDEYGRLILDTVIKDTLPANKFSSVNLFDVLSDGLNEDELGAVVGNILRRGFKEIGRAHV